MSETNESVLEQEQSAQAVEEVEIGKDEGGDEKTEEGDLGSASPSASSLQNLELEHDEVPMLMTQSMKEIYQDIEPPLGSRSNLRINIDAEDVLLKNAIRNIRTSMDEARVISELRKMYDLYLQSQSENQILVSKIDKYLDKIDKYEARHRRDPRVMAALKLAEKHRAALKMIDESKKDLETETIEAKLEVKHLEDVMKTKGRELIKLQDEIRKLRDIEKNAEMYETQLIRKENELRLLTEKCDADVHAAKQATKEEMLKDFALKREAEKETKDTFPDMKRYEFEMAEKRSLMKELDEKNKMVYILDIDRKAKKLLLESVREKSRTLSANVRRMNQRIGLLKREKVLLENEKGKWKMLYETLQIEHEKSEEQLRILRSANREWKMKMQKDQEEFQFLSTKHQEAQKRLAETSNNLRQCSEMSSRLNTDLRMTSDDLTKTSNSLQAKMTSYEQLSKRCNQLQQQKMEQMDLLRMSQAHSMSLAKDVTSLRIENMKQYKRYQDLLSDRARMRANLFLVKNHYFEAEDRCQVLRNEKEMQKNYAGQLEQQASDMQKKIQAVVQTNIQLYCENTTQEEVAVLQNNQYKIKEKEIMGLEFSSQEQNEVIAKLENTCKEKSHMIEQLSNDLLELSEQVKKGKTIIQNMSNEEKILKSQLNDLLEKERAHRTTLEMIRRQRDLFGTRLLKVHAEFGLVKTHMKVSDRVMKSASVSHKNLLNDVRLLKLEIKDLRRRLKIQDGNVLMIDSMRQELAKMATNLELEKSKMKVIEETRVPIIHRWRAVMASDPSRYELFMKMNKLTKGLIAKTTEVAEKETIIQQKDFYMLEIQTLLSRRTVPGLNSEVAEAKSLIRKQNKQLRALQAELNIARHDLSVQTAQIEEHKENLLGVKKQVTQQQRINRKLKQEKSLKLPSICPKIIKPAPPPRYLQL